MLTTTDSISNVDDTAVDASVVVGNGVAANKKQQQPLNRHLNSNHVCVCVCGMRGQMLPLAPVLPYSSTNHPKYYPSL